MIPRLLRKTTVKPTSVYERIIYSGEQFNSLYPLTKYKMINRELKHFNMEYKLGLNTNKTKFLHSNSLIGLHFTDINNIFKYFYCGCYISKISVANDAKINVVNGLNSIIYVADSLIVDDIILIENSMLWENTDFCKCAVSYSPSNLQYISEEYQTFDICLQAVQQNPFAIKYIKNKIIAHNVLMNIYN